MIKTAKDIVNSISNFGKEEVQEKQSRHPAHEFQAFAYKIAADFNDLVNLKIYMNLLKRVDRIVIEQAYTYTIDSSSENKKKIFLWKVKQLRKEIQTTKDIKNFDWLFVLKKMKKFRDFFFKSTIAKFSDPNQFVSFILYYFSSNMNQKILISGLPSTTLVQFCSKISSKLYLYDISPLVRKEFLNNLALYSISPKELKWKDPLSLAKNIPKFDTIIVDSIFSIIPIGYEEEFFNTLKIMSHDKTEIYLNISTKNTTTQEWKRLADGDIEHYYFAKRISIEDLKKHLNYLNANIVEMQENEHSLFLKINFAQ